MMPKSRTILSLFADDIRQEMDGKVTYVGVYQGGMNVNGVPPAVLPKLAISTYIHMPIDERFKTMSLDLMLDNELINHIDVPPEHVLSAGVSAAAQPGEFREITFNAVMVLQPLVLTKGGILRVNAKLDGEELVGNGLRIGFVAPVTTGIPESSTSAPTVPASAAKV